MGGIDALKNQMEALQAQALAAFSAAGNLNDLERLRVRYLGKKGALTEVLKGVGKLPPADRPVGSQNYQRCIASGTARAG